MPRSLSIMRICQWCKSGYLDFGDKDRYNIYININIRSKRLPILHKAKADLYHLCQFIRRTPISSNEISGNKTVNQKRQILLYLILRGLRWTLTHAVCSRVPFTKKRAKKCSIVWWQTEISRRAQSFILLENKTSGRLWRYLPFSRLQYYIKRGNRYVELQNNRTRRW